MVEDVDTNTRIGFSLVSFLTLQTFFSLGLMVRDIVREAYGSCYKLFTTKNEEKQRVKVREELKVLYASS